MSKTFLTAEWRHLAILNYEVDPELLRPHVPPGTELDTWDGRHYASLVAFLFERTRLLRVPVPFHTRFEELNLRFYVSRRVGKEVRRGVRFVKEIVPRRAVASVARLAYGENYVAHPMRHALEHHVDGTVCGAHYVFRANGREHELGVTTETRQLPILPGSEEEFVAEHYWGYTRHRDGTTVEYRVDHPPWRIAPASDTRMTIDLASVYGRGWARALARGPTTAFLADGSAVQVFLGERITPSGASEPSARS